MGQYIDYEGKSNKIDPHGKGIFYNPATGALYYGFFRYAETEGFGRVWMNLERLKEKQQDDEHKQTIECIQKTYFEVFGRKDFWQGNFGGGAASFESMEEMIPSDAIRYDHIIGEKLEKAIKNMDTDGTDEFAGVDHLPQTNLAENHLKSKYKIVWPKSKNNVQTFWVKTWFLTKDRKFKYLGECSQKGKNIYPNGRGFLIDNSSTEPSLYLGEVQTIDEKIYKQGEGWLYPFEV